MNKYDRMLFVLNLLRSRKNMNACMIANECGVTERTIYRDIIALSESNIPIYYDRGYKYASDNFLPPLNFNISEYLTLKLALESSPLHKSGHSKRTIKLIKTKIEACLSQNVKREKIFKSSPTSVIIKSSARYQGDEKFYAVVEKGITENLIIKLLYNSLQSGLTDREIEPYFMIFIERAFYFVGYCRLRKELRTFRIDRIKDITLTDRRFSPKKNIDPVAYFKNSWGVFSGEPVEIEVIMTGVAARVVKTGRHHSNEEIRQIDDNTINYKVTVSGVEEICRWLLGFGGEVTVIKPLNLISIMKSRAKSILKNYK